MKKRVLRDMDNGVYRIILINEDWSEGDRDLMARFGEPEINVGGEVSYIVSGETKTKTLGDEYVRLLRGFPYQRGFDSRDYASVEEAVSIGVAWKEMVLSRIDAAILAMRANAAPLTTEEVSEI